MTVSVLYVSVALSTRATGGHFFGFAVFALDCADAGVAASSVNKAVNTRAASLKMAGEVCFMVSPFVGDLRCAENFITKDFACVADWARAGQEKTTFAVRKKRLDRKRTNVYRVDTSVITAGSWQTALSVKSNPMGPESNIQLEMPIKWHGLVDRFDARL